MAQEIIIKGRPDFHIKNYGITKAKKFPPYVYSTNANGALIHQVRSVDLRWYDVANGGHDLKWRHNPRMSINTKCGQRFFASKGNANVCELPNPDAVMCGRCEGKQANFRKGKYSEERKAANKKLGCLVKAE